MAGRRVLVTGPSGAGKTTLAEYFRKRGADAVDADTADIGVWLDSVGNKVQPPHDIGERAGQWAFMMGLRWNWDVSRLKALLEGTSEIYLFGGAYNVYNVIGLFDRRYYLDADAKLLAERLKSRAAEGKSRHGWGETEEQRSVILSELDEDRKNAAKAGLEFIDAHLPLDQIFEIVTSSTSKR